MFNKISGNVASPADQRSEATRKLETSQKYKTEAPLHAK